MTSVTVSTPRGSTHTYIQRGCVHQNNEELQPNYKCSRRGFINSYILHEVEIRFIFIGVFYFYLFFYSSIAFVFHSLSKPKRCFLPLLVLEQVCFRTGWSAFRSVSRFTGGSLTGAAGSGALLPGSLAGSGGDSMLNFRIHCFLVWGFQLQLTLILLLSRGAPDTIRLAVLI